MGGAGRFLLAIARAAIERYRCRNKIVLSGAGGSSSDAANAMSSLSVLRITLTMLSQAGNGINYNVANSRIRVWNIVTVKTVDMLVLLFEAVSQAKPE
jgi:hypothetical protein